MQKKTNYNANTIFDYCKHKMNYNNYLERGERTL